jgi:hypothetical protein
MKPFQKSARGKTPGAKSLMGGMAALLLLSVSLSGCIIEPIGYGHGGGYGGHHQHWGGGGGWGH